MQTRTRQQERSDYGGPEDHLHIGDVAEATGLTPRTIRYYEELGLLPAPERTQGDFRVYTLRDVRRIAEIARLKGLLGFTLAEIKEIVVAEEAREQLKSELSLAGDTALRLEKLREFERIDAAQLAALDGKIALMTEMRLELEARLATYRERISELQSGSPLRRGS
jgi:DNA-binding transcriptional MerR regulator